MATIGTLTCTIGARTEGLRTSLNKAENNFKRYERKVSQGIGAMKQHWKGLTVVVVAFAYAGKKLADTYLVQERAEKMLGDAMRLGKIYTKEAHEEMLAYATALQQVTKYGDEATLQVMSLLETYRLNINELKWATAASQDFASALGIDVKTAARYMGMALKGNIEMLARYIPQLKSTVTPQLKLMSATEKVTFFLKLMNEQFGGRAQAEMETYGGKLAWLGNLYGDVKEQIGLGLLEAFVGENLDKAENNIKEFGLTIIGWGERISLTLFMVGHAFEGWGNIFDILKLGWLKLVEIILQGQVKILSAISRVTKVLQPEKHKEGLEQLANAQQELVDVMQEQADITEELGSKGKKFAKGYMEIEDRFNGMRDSVKNVNYELLNLPKSFELSVKDSAEGTKKAEDAYKKTLKALEKYVTEKRKLEEDVTDRIYELTHSETQNLIYELDKRREVLRSFKIDEQKINELYALEVAKIHKDANEKIKDQTESIWDDMADVFKTTFTDAVMNELESLEDVWDMLWNRMKYKMVENLGDMIIEWFKGIEKMQTDAQMTVDMAHEAGIEGPGMESGKFFAGSTQLFDKAVNKFGIAAGAISGALPHLALVYEAGKMVAGLVPESTGWQGEAGPKGYIQGMGEMGPVGATLGLFGLHPMGAGEKRHMERVLERVQEFYDEYNDIMEKEYGNLVDMVSDFNHLISSQHIEALEEMGHVSESQVGSLHAVAEALGVMKNEAETAFAVSVGSMRRMETSAKQLALVIPEAADKIGAMTDKMRTLFMEDFMEKFERGLMDVDEAVKQLVRSGMSQLDAQTMLLGEDYNELIVMLGGSIETIDKVSESFNEMYETLDEFDKLIAELPDSFGKVKQSLQELSYGIRYLLNMTQSLINTMEDLTELPEIFESMGKAIEEGDWDQAAKDLYKLQNIALEASSAFTRLGEALDYLKMVKLGGMFTGIGQVLMVLAGILAVIRMIAEFFGVWDDLLKGIQIAFLNMKIAILEMRQDWADFWQTGKDFSDEIAKAEQDIKDLNGEVDQTIDKFDLWLKKLEDMEASQIISNIAAGLREWQDIIDRFTLGDIAVDMNNMLFDMWKMMTQIEKMWGPESKTADPEKYTKAMEQLREAMVIQINKYFDAIVDAFSDFQDKLKRDIQALSPEGRTVADVTADMGKVFWDMGGLGGFTEEMDPGEYLANAEEMRGLILEKYAIEKAELEETRRLIEEKYNMEIAKFEQIKSAWMSVLDDVTAKLDSLKTSGMNQRDIFERMGEQMSIIQRLEGEAMGETDIAKRAGIESQIASAYMDYLGMAETAYTRPSSQYKEIYDMVVGKLEALQLEAQETISVADQAIISLNEEMKVALGLIDKQLENLRLQTIAKLQWLSDQTEAAKGVLEDMRDDALAAIELDIEEMRKYLSGEKIPAAQTIRDSNISSIADNTANIIIAVNNVARAISGLATIEATRATADLGHTRWGGASYQHGIESVPRTELALVHQGEKITPAGENGGDISVYFGDIHLDASKGMDMKEQAGVFMEEVEHGIRWGRLGKIIKEETRNVA